MTPDKPKRHDSELIEGDLTGEIIAAFYTVYNALGYGYLESVLANALAIELRARGRRVEREVGIEVHYLGVLAGTFRRDLLVEGRVIVECKATEQLSPAAKSQVLNYLKCTSHPVALLLHFGSAPKHYRFVSPRLLGNV